MTHRSLLVRPEGLEPPAYWFEVYAVMLPLGFAAYCFVRDTASLRPESSAVSARLAVKLAVKNLGAPIRELSLKYQEKWAAIREAPGHRFNAPAQMNSNGVVRHARRIGWKSMLYGGTIKMI